MKSKYELPQFNSYIPKKLIKLTKKLDDQGEISAFDFSSQKKEKTIEKLQKGSLLKKGEMKVLLYYLDELEEKGLLERFLVKMKKFFSQKQKMYYHLKAGLFSYYKLYKCEPIYNAVRLGFYNNLEWKSEASFIKELFYDCKNVRDFFQRLYKEINICKTKEEFEEKIELLMLKKDTPLLNIILPRIVLNSIDESHQENIEYLIELVKEYIPKNKYAEIFEKVLLASVDINIEDISRETDLWFKFIGGEFGDPYGRFKTKWSEVSNEAKKVFQRWKVFKQITHFFSEITGDPRRLNFWKQYVNHFNRIHYIEKCSKAFLMETDKHLFIEFAAGGALYMYRKDILNIQKVKDMIDSYSKTYITSEVLKSRNKCEEYLVHRGSWEDDFRRRFEYYEYYT